MVPLRLLWAEVIYHIYAFPLWVPIVAKFEVRKALTQTLQGLVHIMGHVLGLHREDTASSHIDFMFCVASRYVCFSVSDLPT